MKRTQKEITWTSARNSRRFAFARKLCKAFGLEFKEALKLSRSQPLHVAGQLYQLSWN